MSSGRHRPNAALSRALVGVGWTPYDLAKRINQELGVGFVHRTTPYAWCKQGSKPRPPLPDLVARLLSRASGRLIRPGDLWPDLVEESGHLAADDGLGGADPDRWLQNLPLALDSEAESAGLMCVSGAELLAFIRTWESQPRVPHLVEQAPTDPGSGDPVLDHLRADLARLRAIDDDSGGHVLLVVVAHQQRLLAQLALHHGGGSARAYEYLALLAQYCQFAGWLAMDLEEHSRAQRHFLLGLRLAQLVRDRDLLSMIISLLGVQCMNRGALRDAVVLTRYATSGPTTAATAAITWMRRGRAFATLGEARDTEASFERAAILLADADCGPRQPWTYWLTPDILSAEEGRCLVDLGRSRSAQVSLARVIHRSAGTGRDRVLYGAALVQAHLAAGDLDQACEELRRTAGLLGGVSSQRCRVILRDIVDNLSCRRLPRHQRELVGAAYHMLITDGKAL